MSFIRNSDIIDIRPKVSDIATVSEGDRSPLEFNGRSFNVTGNSAPNILASNEGILMTSLSILVELSLSNEKMDLSKLVWNSCRKS